MERLPTPPERVIQPFDDIGQARIQRVRNRRENGSNISTFRARGSGFFSVFCIIANRMIGTGIFRTPNTIMGDTHSPGTAMLFWFVGALISVCGTLVYVEFGLAIPRIVHGNAAVSVPRNGGEKNYLEHVYSRPRLLVTCLYGIPFICLGNMAGNAIVFGENILITCGATPSNSAVRGIAVGVATLACTLHIVSRRLGIALNNFFGSIKILMLLAIVVIGIISFCGGFVNKTIANAETNFDPEKSFQPGPVGSYGYAASFLSILFAYGGFNQANYVLGGIYRPQRRFKATALLTVSCVGLLYICVNLCYLGVVPYKQSIASHPNIVVDFFTWTIASSSGSRVVAAFLSFSSLGNIIIQTFTAARVKQELAKEGILPFSRFFARNRIWRWTFWKKAFKDDHEDSEATPVGALLLHWAFSMALILGTFGLSPRNAYQVYVSLYSFTIDALFGFFVGLGLLVLRSREESSKWSTISRENKYVSIAAATIYMLGNLYPLIAIWVKPSRNAMAATSVSWWVTGTVGLSVVLLGLLYWVGVTKIAPRLLESDLKVDRTYVTNDEGGELVVMNEIVEISWISRI